MNNPLALLFKNRQFQAIAGIQVFNVFSAQLLAPVLPLYLASQGLSASRRMDRMTASSSASAITSPTTWTPSRTPSLRRLAAAAGEGQNRRAAR